MTQQNDSLINRASVLRALGVGRKNGKTAAHLVQEICGLYMRPHNDRELRSIVNELRKEGNHICATPKDGYFIAETEQEMQETYKFLYGRAMDSLKQISAMKRIPLPNLKKQLGLAFEDND